MAAPFTDGCDEDDCDNGCDNDHCDKDYETMIAEMVTAMALISMTIL